MEAFVSSCTACCSVRGENSSLTWETVTFQGQIIHKEPRKHVLPPPGVNSSIMQVAHALRFPKKLQIWVKSNSGLQNCGWRFCITGINCLTPMEHGPYEDLPLCLNPNYLFLLSHTILIPFLQKASLQLITTYRRTKFGSH